MKEFVIEANQELVDETNEILKSSIPDDLTSKHELYNRLSEMEEKLIQHNEETFKKVDEYLNGKKAYVGSYKVLIYLNSDIQESIKKIMAMKADIWSPKTNNRIRIEIK